MSQTYTLQTISFDDFKKIKHVARALDGAVTLVGGKNAQGKSSVIQGIDVLLYGAKMLPKDPIRKGADCAVLAGTIETPVGTLSVRRVVTMSNGKPRVSTEVTGGPGMESTAPQRLLDQLVGAGSRDVLAFLDMKPKEQVDEVQKILGLNFDAVNKRRKEAYDARTIQNGVVDTLAKRFEGMQGVPANTPDAEVSAADLTTKLNEAAEFNAQGNQLAQRHQDLTNQLAEGDQWLERTVDEITAELEAIETLERQLNDRKEKLSEKTANHLNAVSKRDVFAKAVETAKVEAEKFKPVDTTELNNALAQVDETNRNVRLKADLKRAKKDWEDAKAASNKLSEEIEACDKEKRDRLANTQMPVEGLSFDDEGILYNDLSLESASDAEKRIVAIGLAFASDADLKVKSIRDGSLLDDDALRHVAELVEQHGGHLVIERVGYGTENTFILESGEEIDAEALAKIRKLQADAAQKEVA